MVFLNGVSFHEQPLEPLGVELTPAGEAVALQPWLKINVTEVSEFVRDRGLVVLTTALHAEGDEWAPIEPVTPHISTRFPHVDRSFKTNGPNDGLAWMLLGKSRSPTAFVRGSVLRDAMVQHREIITNLNAEELHDAFRATIQCA